MAGLIPYSTDTRKILSWAARAHREDETIATFWKALCEQFDLDTGSEGKAVLDALREAGSNTMVDWFRDESVPYREVAWDVAEKLRPYFDDCECSEDDPISCEGYVLKQMEIEEEDIESLCEAVRSRGRDEANRDGYEKAGRSAAAEAAAYAVARYAAKKTAEKAIAEASKRVAKRVAAEVSKQIIARVMVAVNVALAVLTIVDLAGPAYRNTIPGVTYIAILRKLHAAAAAGI